MERADGLAEGPSPFPVIDPAEALRITVIGAGYVGLVAGVCFARFGHHITCVEQNPERLGALQKGEAPIYEPGLEDALAAAVSSERLTFANALPADGAAPDIYLLAVGTPEDPVTGAADMRYLFAALEDIAVQAQDGAVIVTKSTVPVGTAERINAFFKEQRPNITVEAVSNPEFLREGFALSDFTRPDRIICGCGSDKAASLCRRLYKPLTDQGYRLDIYGTREAETVKYAANGFLAMKIAFINEIADFCEATGADAAQVAHGIGSDSRIGPKFLAPGPGYGGSCFPKDTVSLLTQTELAGAPSRLIEAAIKANAARTPYLIRRLEAFLAPETIAQSRICILGAAFKAGTDDVRESPALRFVRYLLAKGAKDIRITDPQALDNAKKALDDCDMSALSFTAVPEEALKSCDCAVILTEWPCFAELFPETFLRSAAKGARIFDMRNILQPGAIRAAGIPYARVGEGLPA